MNNLFDETRKVSIQNPDKDILLRLAKLQEEAGELAKEALQVFHYKKRTDASGIQHLENMREEACDVLLVALDIIHILDIPEQELIRRIASKLPKWEKGIENYIAAALSNNEQPSTNN
jgi:NTP pyrophosphatase (non-canonical NTP hydrolase)